MKTKLSAAVLSAVLACASAAASEVRLSLSSPDEYHYIQIPSNMVASIEGRGMVSNEATGHVPLRYEDAAFIREAVAERFAFFSELSSGVGGTNYFSSSSYGLTSEEIRHRNFDIPLSSRIWNPAAPYAKPEAQAFTNDVVSYNPYNSNGVVDINESNVWSTVFSTAYPAMFFTKEDITPSVAAITNGSPLRFSAIKDCYAFVGNLSRPCFSDAAAGSLDGKRLDEIKRDVISSTQILRYDGLKKTWVYGTDYHTNDTSVVSNRTISMSKTINLYATRKKSIGRSGGEIVTDITPSSSTETRVNTYVPNSFPIINLFPVAQELGDRKYESVTSFFHGRLVETESKSGDLGISSSRDYHYFIVRVDSPAFVQKAPYAIVLDECPGKDFLDTIFEKVVAWRYGSNGLPYKTAAELLEDVPTPPDPTGADDYHVSTSVRLGRSYGVRIERAYIIYNGMKFNARVLEDGE